VRDRSLAALQFPTTGRIGEGDVVRWKVFASIVLLLCICVLIVCAEPQVIRLFHDPAGRKEAEARARLPFESLEHRMPTGRPIPPAVPLSEEATERWAGVDSNVKWDQSPRARWLKELHERTYRFFVEEPGFGSGRRLYSPEHAVRERNEFDLREVDQRGLPATFPLSQGEEVRKVEPEPADYQDHARALREFLNGDGFGYVKDRKHVAGFWPHGFRHAPDVYRGKWAIRHVQLVSILMNEKPLVYLSDKMPRMELLSTGRSRPLDRFEEVGLRSLKRGEDLHAIRKDDTLRMLGAVRATLQCQRCHEAHEGDLLGAFSYTLTLRPKSDD
jgi:hypothetical protein